MRREEKKRKKAKKMEKKLVVKEKAAEGETTATVDQELMEEIEIRLFDNSSHSCDVERNLVTPTVRFVEDFEMQDKVEEMEVDRGPSFENLLGDPVDNTVVSAGESVVLGTSGASFTEEAGVGATGGEEMVGTEVDEFSFVVGGDFDVQSSKLKTSTPQKTTDAQPVEHEVEDFFAYSLFKNGGVHAAPLEKGDSNEQAEICRKSVSKPDTTQHFHASNELSSKTSNMEAGVCPISDDFMQMMEEFDNNSRDGGPAELESQKDLQPAREIAVEATSVDNENTDGKEELFLEARDAVGADRKVFEVNVEKDESSGSSAVAWSPDNSDDDPIVLDSGMEEDTEESVKTKKAATKECIDWIEIDEEEDVKWRLVRITEREKKLQEQGVIKEYGILPRDQYQFPFDPYEGLCWPVFQPFDDVDFRNKNDTDAADVKNQLTDLSVCNYISKQELLCDAVPNKWAHSVKEADRMSEKEKNG